MYEYKSVTAASRLGTGSARVVDIDEDGIPELVSGNAIFKFSDGNFDNNTTLDLVIDAWGILKSRKIEFLYIRDTLCL